MKSELTNKNSSEIWKPIKNYEGLYEVSNLGNVRSLSNRWGTRKKERKVKQQLTAKNYKRISLSKNNKKKSYLVHCLVYTAFYGEIPLNYEVNHKDYNRTNNNLNNLELLTHEDNVRYSKGMKIKQYDLNHNLIKVWESVRLAGKELNINHRQIRDNLKGRQKTCHGFIFEKEVA